MTDPTEISAPITFDAPPVPARKSFIGSLSAPSAITAGKALETTAPIALDLKVPSKKLMIKPRKTKEDREALNNARAAERSKDDSTPNLDATEKRPLFTIVGKKASVDDVAETLEDLASMLEAGDSEDRAVKVLAEQYKKTNVGAAYARVTARMRDDGDTIIEAMGSETDVFPRVARELIAAGTTPRDLHNNLRQASRIIVESSDIQAQIRSALFKPMMTLGIVVIFIVVAAQWLLPGVATMFTSIGAKIPPLTLVMISIGGSVKWVLGGIVVLILSASIFWVTTGRKNKKLRVMRDKFAITAPLVGQITKMSTAARFSDVLAACLSSGMTELDALEIAGRSCGNEAVEAHVREHIAKQRVGEAVFGDVTHSPLFPWNLSHRIEIAPSPRQRIEVMRDLAEIFHKKSKRRLAAFADRVGPLTEIVVLTAAAVVILMVAIPVTTFAPALMNMGH